MNKEISFAEKTPLVTVIIPVYKVEKYLEECVDSVRNQTYVHLEIILVDDGSPDSCGAICDRYAAKDPRIQVIHKRNGGLSDARNAGMAVAKGQYWCFVDSDDHMDLRALEVLVAEACKTHADIVVSQPHPFVDGTVCEPIELSRMGETLDQAAAMRRFVSQDWGAWGKLYRKNVHEGILFPVGKIHEDEAIMFQILDRCETVSILPDRLYNYRKRADSITSVPYSIRKMDWLYAWAKNVEHVGKKNPELYLRCVSKLWTVMLYNLNHLIGQEGYARELDDIVELATKYKKDILKNPYVSGPAKLRLRILGLSDILNPNCLYARAYSLRNKLGRK